MFIALAIVQQLLKVYTPLTWQEVEIGLLLFV